ncbi:hypothetical protein SGQ83_10210 [Flavobacterium sp. Fl-318]|uniref:Lipoprotein n=1 Tax=Flavobacterium cupriresistens TaxID=2893885 RepID=A0ABU4RAV8_9FLAO|nr:MULTISPECIES: hypothetical protein [unclassified Flavobacterium]MDX6189725.1 hypothetical protein [Flavobacterium sp. Fl-318]UFH40869.1 hypothetical protein LNP23_13745 [Flavobacterium sp. F-323]
MKFKIIFFLLTVTLLSCKNKETNTKKELSIQSKDFEVFLKKFKTLKFPLNIKTSDIQIENLKAFTKNDLKFLDLNNIDPDLDNVYPYGILPDTLEAYKVIYLLPAETHIPVIATYTKEGKKISTEELGVGGCGADCGFTCAAYIKIDRNLKIHSVDSITSHQCDSLGPILNTKRNYTHFKDGTITKKGKITFSKTIEQY